MTAKVRKRLGKFVYAYEDIGIPEAVGKILARKRQTLAVAESCTGGRLASEITAIAGASRHFKGSVTAYQNSIKRNMLGVSSKELSKKGAVSGEVAKGLACGVRERMQSTYGLGLTGVAGPTGASAKKPVGTICIAVATPRRTSVSRYHFWGNRNQIQIKAAKKALEILWRILS